MTRTLMRLVFEVGAALHLIALAAFSQCQRWSTEFGSLSTGVWNTVHSMHVHDDGTGPALYVGGTFSGAGTDGLADGVARWNGTSWSNVGYAQPDDIPFAFATWDDGTGPKLYMGGMFEFVQGLRRDHIARWDGQQWSSMGGGLQHTSGAAAVVRVLAVHDPGTGPVLYVGGSFIEAGGSTPLLNIASWHPGWGNLGEGITLVGEPSHLARVYSMCSFDDGSGPMLFVSGRFNRAGGMACDGFARWNGTSWFAVPSPNPQAIGGYATDMIVYDDGNGRALYSCTGLGVFRWDGGGWSLLPGMDPSGSPRMGSFDDGSGLALYVVSGGMYLPEFPENLVRVFRWRAQQWEPFYHGIWGDASSLAVYDDGAGPDLYVGGNIYAVGHTLPSYYVAKWEGCTRAVEANCFGDRTIRVCPCVWAGQYGHGCYNSASPAGARLYSSGAPSPDTLAFHASGMVPGVAALFFQGDAFLPTPALFGDGLRCAGGTLRRMYLKTAVNGQAIAPEPGDPSVTARAAYFG